MSAPRLNVALVLETADRVPDGLGGFRTVWRAEGRLWAEMKAGVGTESFAEVGPKSVVRWQITLRAAPAGDPRRPRAGQRFRLGERILRILAVAERDATGRWLGCLAQEEGQA
ncbi:head-tail adaptor protein [Paracoccus aminophilus]|uniref:Phage head-tail adaptor protein n=1 Tax=Paracoccus aminophilus JCM 7686 TaxID=1367847 RepID=S5XRJ4_PARAH|nr:head-tail adaptor protein [Paracoccus aminophilus]AGT07707.1 phage head-tail adaptor protein [Paracoccus aminophilus JCM 7686]